ncbi:MAG: molybdopterin-guanine dinucleotide biosynthesis protein MobB [Dehalococcoidia bacterium]|nr:molybdopterin-guanine dinucleotide biosynthesis protein MobB [Dehalococcoidia bacterium]
MTAGEPVPTSLLTMVLPLVRVTGSGRNIGKTWLAERLVMWFESRDYRVAAIKDSHHRMMDDKAGSDTERLALAGASPVIFRAGDGVLTRVPGVPPALPSLANTLVDQVDLVIAEGFRDERAGARLQIGEARPRRVAFRDPGGCELGTWAIDDIDAIGEALEAAFALSAAGEPALRAAVRRAVGIADHRSPDITVGVRMAEAASESLGIPFPPSRGALRATAEMARCATDAIAIVAACSAGRGTLRIQDRGVTAATFVSRTSGRGVRVSLRADAPIEMPGEGVPPGISSSHEHAFRTSSTASLFDVECISVAASTGTCHPAQGW